MKEMFRRAVRTFVEAALGYVTANVVMLMAGQSFEKGAAVNALAALITASVASGIAAVLNMPKSGNTPDNKEEN